jgi:D-alanine--D-alanine ligase
MKKLSIGVIMGTRSLEREVSFNTGRTLCDYLDTTRYTPVPIFIAETHDLYILPWRFLHRGKISDFEHRLAEEATRISWDTLRLHVDFVYPAVHGRWGEDGALQGMLELLKIPYFGSKVVASALGMDKNIQKTFLAHADLKTPRSICLSGNCIAQYTHNKLEALLTKESLSAPYIVKPRSEGSSFGVSRVESSERLLEAVYKAATITPHIVQDVLIEECVVGMEFSCIVIENNGEYIALEPTEIARSENELFDYEQKYMPGAVRKYTPARCSESARESIKNAAIRTMQALGFRSLGRIDGILDTNGSITIIDPNSSSGMSPASFVFFQAAEYGMSHTDFVQHLIKQELSEYGMLFHESTPSEKSSKKMRIGVILGGASNEREISLESGRNVVYKLSPHTYTVTPLFLSSQNELFSIPHRLLVKNSTQVIEELLEPEMRVLWSDLPERFDCIFLGLHGGAGENGTIQGALEMLGLPYNGSGILASGLCMDKWKTNNYLASHGIDIPEHILIQHLDTPELAVFIEKNGFPLIVKPHDDGCSVGVYKVFSSAELMAACDKIFKLGKEYALIEEYIEGMELTVGVLGNNNPQALPPTHTVAHAGILSITEKFLPGAGENQTPAPLDAAATIFVQRTIERVFSVLNCSGYARIDCFYQRADQNKQGRERVVVLEVNTLPALTPATCLFHQAAEAGMNPRELLDTIIRLGFERHTHTEQIAHKELSLQVQQQ